MSGKGKTNNLLTGASDFMNDSDNLPDLANDMNQFENYKNLEVDNAKLILKKDAKTFVKRLCDLYLQTDQIQRPEYVESIEKLETMTLASLLAQVKYAEHSLESLMRQLDSGGFQDQSVYKMIMEMQSNSINITMQVSQYIRTLPEYFKNLEEDITKYQSINLTKTGSSNLSDEEGKSYETDEYESEDYTFRGTADVISMIEAAEKQSEERQKEVQEKISSIDSTNKYEEAEDATEIDDDDELDHRFKTEDD